MDAFIPSLFPKSTMPATRWRANVVDLDAILRRNPEIVSSPAELLEQQQQNRNRCQILWRRPRTTLDEHTITADHRPQTGADKTHTMVVSLMAKCMIANTEFMQRQPDMCLAFWNVSASFFKIYNCKVFNLLSNKQKLRVLEDGIQQVRVVGLTEKWSIASKKFSIFVQNWPRRKCCLAMWNQLARVKRPFKKFFVY